MFPFKRREYKLYDEINLRCNNFSQLNTTDKLIWLMAVDNPDILTRFSNMVQKANVKFPEKY